MRYLIVNRTGSLIDDLGHDPDYRTSLKDFDSFLQALTEKIIELDETVPELPVKDIVSRIMVKSKLARIFRPWQIFRIYRDVRFSNDKVRLLCSSKV